MGTVSDLAPRDLAVVIPTRDRPSVLPRTLDALARRTATGFETVVVVDGTDQDVPDLPGARVVVREQGGPGAARNTGSCATDRHLVLFLGDDMVPDPGLVERHLDTHRRNPEAHVAVLGEIRTHPEVPRDRIMRWLEWSASQFAFSDSAGEEACYGLLTTSTLQII